MNLNARDSIKVSICVYHEIKISPDFISLEISFFENNSSCSEDIGATNVYDQYEIFKKNLELIDTKNIEELTLMENLNHSTIALSFSIYPIKKEDLKEIFDAAKISFGQNVKLYSWLKCPIDEQKNNFLSQAITKSERKLKILKNVLNKEHEVLCGFELEDDEIVNDGNYLFEDYSKTRLLDYYKFEISNINENELYYECEIDIDYIIF